MHSHGDKVNDMVENRLSGNVYHLLLSFLYFVHQTHWPKNVALADKNTGE